MVLGVAPQDVSKYSAIDEVNGLDQSFTDPPERLALRKLHSFEGEIS